MNILNVEEKRTYMLQLKYLLICVASSLAIYSCDQVSEEDLLPISPNLLHNGMHDYSEVIVYDIFSPPVASRNYVYASIAAYEVIAATDSTYSSLSGQLHELSALPPAPQEPFNASIASLEAFYQAGLHFIFSEEKLLKSRDQAIAKIKESGISKSVLKNSLTYGKSVADHIIAWSGGDNYKQSRTFPKFSITQDPARWKPTPPGYMDGIEPHWRDIRTFVLDAPEQFVPGPPTPYSMDEESQFFKETKEVYDIGSNLDNEQKEIASFWDCNPYVLNVTGHVMHATKKITPGGHWISIIGIASRKANADYAKSVSAYALTSIALADGFISCWDEKYRSNLVRPETVINEHIDENWVPFLQTPPFPEHTSGHSVISRAAAVALTSIYGDNFAFDDDTEVKYGIPIRSFKSFIHASEEAAVSRLYGGIHYRPAIDVGVEQGQKVGDYIVEKIKLRT